MQTPTQRTMASPLTLMLGGWRVTRCSKRRTNAVHVHERQREGNALTPRPPVVFPQAEPEVLLIGKSRHDVARDGGRRSRSPFAHGPCPSQGRRADAHGRHHEHGVEKRQMRHPLPLIQHAHEKPCADKSDGDKKEAPKILRPACPAFLFLNVVRRGVTVLPSEAAISKHGAPPDTSCSTVRRARRDHAVL